MCLIRGTFPLYFLRLSFSKYSSNTCLFVAQVFNKHPPYLHFYSSFRETHYVQREHLKVKYQEVLTRKLLKKIVGVLMGTPFICFTSNVDCCVCKKKIATASFSAIYILLKLLGLWHILQRNEYIFQFYFF